MSGVVIYSSANTHGKRDATHAFIPEARAFANLHGIPATARVGIACPGTPQRLRYRQVLQAIERVGQDGPLELLAVFGHGWPSGIQFGISKTNVGDLVEVLKTYAAPTLKVALFTCLTAENSIRDRILNWRQLGPATDGGFADQLRDRLAVAGISEGWVDGHKTAGHTAVNPYVVRFLGAETPQTGGAWLVEPRSQLWRHWREALHGDLRFRYPLMTEMEVKAELLSATA